MHRPPTEPAHPRPRRAAAAWAWLLPVLLAGCGGGIYLGFGDDGDDPPDVSLTSAVTVAAAGDSVALAAAASDDYRVDEVRLYEVADNGSLLLLATDTQPPYQWTVVLPAALSGRVRYMARAIDDIGQRADSNLVEIMLR